MMVRSKKPWHTSVLISCVVALLVACAAPVQAQEPDGTVTAATYVMNQFTALANELLIRVGFWTEAANHPGLSFQMSIYREFVGGGLSDLAWKTDSPEPVNNAGYFEVLVPQIQFSPDDNYYIVLGLSGGSGATQYSYYLDDTVSYYATATSDYSFGLGGGTWEEAEGVSWAIHPVTTEVGPGPGRAGNWDAETPTYEDGLLSINKTALIDLGPFDMEIVEVTGTPETITIEEAVTNLTGTAWEGYYIQLGSWENGEFVLADGDLKFVPLTVDSDVFANVVVSDYELFFDGGLIDDGTLVNFSFDVHDPSGIGTFALRQWAVVPEPGSVLLLGLAALTLLAFGRRRRS